MVPEGGGGMALKHQAEVNGLGIWRKSRLKEANEEHRAIKKRCSKRKDWNVRRDGSIHKLASYTSRQSVYMTPFSNDS